jgi:hypothetical protein
MPWWAPGWFECLPGYLEKYPDWSYIARIQLLQALYLLCNRIFSSSNKFKGYKITDLTRPIEFGPRNCSTSNKEPGRIRPLHQLIYNKDPSCYKAEHTLLGLLFGHHLHASIYPSLFCHDHSNQGLIVSEQMWTSQIVELTWDYWMLEHVPHHKVFSICLHRPLGKIPLRD